MKKRTVICGYGKFHQRAQARGAAATQRGNNDMAAVEFAMLAKPNPIGGKRRPANIRGH